MKNTIKTVLGLAGLGGSVALVAALSWPAQTSAFSLIGGSLAQAQRDFRVFNNFTDASANNNVTPHVNFPGATGAKMAIWKGQVEWSSGPYAGNGLGDGITGNANLGDGGANFDNITCGSHTAQGGSNGNVHSAQTGGSCGGGTLAYTQTPISDGWTIRYCESWTWQDGPGSNGSYDLQGVACHEIGHSLGLGHTSTSGATMVAFISGSGTAARSIATDDINGVKAIYGTKSATKPTITAKGGSSSIGGVMTITGTQFAATANEVWFTKASPTDGNPVKVTGLSSGGTSISVTIPAGVADGEFMVKKGGVSGNSGLSNAWPIDIL